MKEVLQKIKNFCIWIWQGANKESRAILSICAILTLSILAFNTISSCQKKETASVSGRPDIKIKSVFYKGQIYQESPTSQSEVLNFFIPIRNEGNGTAYDVQIKKKVLVLPRGSFDLKEPSLKTVFTSTPFDLSPRKTIVDTIFIDEAPAYMKKVISGDQSITLEYEIRYYEDSNKKDKPFVYKYKNTTINGQFQDDNAEKSSLQELKS